MGGHITLKRRLVWSSLWVLNFLFSHALAVVTQANTVQVNLSQNNFISGATCLGTNEACYKEAAACPAGTKENSGKECFLKTLKCCITGKLLVMRPLQLVSHVEQKLLRTKKRPGRQDSPKQGPQ